MPRQNDTTDTPHQLNDQCEEALFEKIAEDIYASGYSINPSALTTDLTEQLLQQKEKMRSNEFELAGIGRDSDMTLKRSIRNDKIAWINGTSEAGANWLNWTSRLQHYLNRRLFMGLFSFESHYAHYPPGHFYKRHRDAFKGEANRVLSLVTYLNHDWMPDDGGEMVLYQDDQDQRGISITPSLGTLVVFLSEEFPHEVLPAKRDRFSIAGWFRVNTSIGNKVDPPR